MGTYLSTPVKDKCEESGDHLECPQVPCRWGVVDMQGWRKNMEDAHVAATDIPMPKYMNKTESEAPAENIGDAKVFGVFDGHGGPEVARFCSLYLISVLTQQSAWQSENEEISSPNENGSSADPTNPATHGVGKALVTAFHAIDRMIDDPANRDELAQLKTQKPIPGVRKEATSIPETTPIFGSSQPQDETDTTSGKETSRQDQQEDTSAAKSQSISTTADESSETSGSTSTPDNNNNNNNNNDKDDADADADSQEVVGKEEASKEDQDLMNDDEDDSSNDADADDLDNDADVEDEPNSQVSQMFQKIMQLSAVASGQADAGQVEAVAPVAPVSGPNAKQPSVVHNGRMICNLPDHAVHAGCTAIVAVITGKTLTVANAGDSRAVLCRGNGDTVALSYDHKPQQEREMQRISGAGGFVNQFGRVNGNLNLSRSLGDLKYKQVPGISPAEQMITAQPDILQVTLRDDDEFIILGCDGIWDCLTNEEAVQYVRKRIDYKLPTDIGKEMLDDIISVDPRTTQGIGGDNMTIMVIDLKPSSRSGKAPEPVIEEEKEKASEEVKPTSEESKEDATATTSETE